MTALDMGVVQWGTSPYTENAGWEGSPASLDNQALASRVLSVVLQSPIGTGVLGASQALLPDALLVCDVIELYLSLDCIFGIKASTLFYFVLVGDSSSPIPRVLLWIKQLFTSLCGESTRLCYPVSHSG